MSESSTEIPTAEEIRKCKRELRKRYEREHEETITSHLENEIIPRFKEQLKDPTEFQIEFMWSWREFRSRSVRVIYPNYVNPPPGRVFVHDDCRVKRMFCQKILETTPAKKCTYNSGYDIMDGAYICSNPRVEY